MSKFNTAHIESNVLSQVSDAILNPPEENKYQHLKKQIITIHTSNGCRIEVLSANICSDMLNKKSLTIPQKDMNIDFNLNEKKEHNLKYLILKNIVYNNLLQQVEHLRVC